LIVRIVDYELEDQIPTPVITLTDHTLPITSLHIGLGPLILARIFSSSLDGTVKVWAVDSHTRSDSPDLSFCLLASFSLPSPISEIIVDPLERYFFAMTTLDEGVIHLVKLFTAKQEDLPAMALTTGHPGELYNISQDNNGMIKVG
jgi:pre-rRNA-processing protein IPI3